MISLDAALIAATAALAGVLLGFLVRWAEFRRERRFTVYTDFLTAFLAIAQHGSHDPGRPSVNLVDEFRLAALQARMVRTRHMAKPLDDAEAMIETADAIAQLESGIDRTEASALARRIASKAWRDVSGFGLPI